jgi:hypothetical protein
VFFRNILHSYCSAECCFTDETNEMTAYESGSFFCMKNPLSGFLENEITVENENGLLILCELLPTFVQFQLIFQKK